MRFATREQDFWRLISGESEHAQHPDSFQIPPADARHSLQRGRAAKLLFEIEAEEEGTIHLTRERMWVIVSERHSEFYIGILDSQPACLTPAPNVYLCFGAEIAFLPEHIIDIAEPPQEYVEWQLSQPPERLWPRA